MANETELAFIAKMTNPSGLSQASHVEKQEQWDFFPPTRADGTIRGRQRVRKTTIGDESKYALTIKIPSTGGVVDANEEVNADITEEVFNAWIRAFGEKGCLKTRYVFVSKSVKLQYEDGEIELPEVKYEVDVLEKEDGTRASWVKVDIEIDHLLEFIEQKNIDPKKFDLTVHLSSLPIGLERAFSMKTDNPEEKEAIKHFWDYWGITRTA